MQLYALVRSGLAPDSELIILIMIRDDLPDGLVVSG